MPVSAPPRARSIIGRGADSSWRHSPCNVSFLAHVHTYICLRAARTKRVTACAHTLHMPDTRDRNDRDPITDSSSRFPAWKNVARCFTKCLYTSSDVIQLAGSASTRHSGTNSHAMLTKLRIFFASNSGWSLPILKAVFRS